MDMAIAGLAGATELMQSALEKFDEISTRFAVLGTRARRRNCRAGSGPVARLCLSSVRDTDDTRAA
jgi:hypothetical protein